MKSKDCSLHALPHPSYKPPPVGNRLQPVRFPGPRNRRFSSSACSFELVAAEPPTHPRAANANMPKDDASVGKNVLVGFYLVLNGFI